MRYSLTLALALLISPALGQVVPASAPPEQSFDLPRFTEGLYTRYSANVIPDNSLAEALNVLLDEDVDGVAVRRNGYSKCNATAAEGAKSFRGLWKFDSADGTHYMVGVSSETMFWHDGDCVWAQMSPAISGLSSTRELECVQALGRFYCANGAIVFWHDGSSSGTVSGAPLGDKIDTFRNRILLGNISGAQSQLKMSGELDGTDWTLAALSTSPVTFSIGGVNDGNIVKCLMGAYQDAYIIGKEDSIWALYGFDYTDFAIREISREVGCIEQRTVKEKNGCLYWLSKRGLERMCGNRIDRVSDPIRDMLDTIVATAGNERTITDTSQTDFEAGNLTVSGPGAPMSATISAGNLLPSSWTHTDTSASDWSGGTFVNVSTGDEIGSVMLSSTVFQDNFSDGNYTSNKTWTIVTGAFTASANSLRTVPTSVTCEATTPSEISTGSWSWTHSYYDQNTNRCAFASNCFDMRFLRDSSGNYYSVRVFDDSGKVLRLIKNYSSSESKLSETALGTYSEMTQHNWEVVRDSIGVISVYLDDVFKASATDTSITTQNNIYFAASPIYSDGSSYNEMDNLFVYRYESSGSFTSGIFDTSLSTPIWGPFAASISSSSIGAQNSITFEVQSSSDPDDTFETLVTQTPDYKIGAKNGRYIRYKSIFQTELTTVTPRLDSITLGAATTGYFISQCRSIGTAVTSWGNFTCNTVPNNGSLTFYISTGTTCGNVISPSTANWNAQTNNSVIAVATSAYVAYRVLFDLDTATETPTLQDCTIAWNDGETRPPAASAIYQDRYYLSHSSSTSSGAVNDHILVLDKNDKWTLFDDHNCYSLANYERKLYCGSANANGYVYQMDSGKDDDGSSFTSSIRTKAYSFGQPDARKQFNRLGLELDPEPNDSDSINLSLSYYVDRGTVAHSMGTVDLGEDPYHVLWADAPFSDEDIVTGRYLQLGITASGVNQPFRIFGGKLKFRYIRPD
ncbi:MAG: hypothetical protein WC713_00870 [Candidatus Methylomirabilota bacterium]